MLELTELQRLEQAATSGPWEAYTDCPGECCWLIRQPERDDAYTDGVTWPETSQEDAEFIAAMRNATPKLIAVALAAKYVAYSNGFDAALPDKLASLRTALEGLK